MRDRWLLVTGVAVTALVCAAATWFPRSSPPPPQFYISGVIVDEAGESMGRCLLDSVTGEEIAIWSRRDGTFRWPFPVLEFREYDVGASCYDGKVAIDTILVTGDMNILLVAK